MNRAATLADVTAAMTEPRMKASTVWTLPASWYADPDIYEAERRTIFSREWLWIGREAEVAEPGQYMTAAPAGFPIFVRRAEDGTLHAFHNVCRHRASKLLTEPSGRCRAIECPYHGWRYRSDGTLDHVPLFGEAPDFPKNALSLFAISVEAWRGLLFVCLNVDAPPFLDWLGPVEDSFARTAPAQVNFGREVTYMVACNWKTYVDNYQEGYHIPPLHPSLHRDLDWTRYRVINFEGGSLHDGPQKGGSTHPGSYGWRFPNFTFNSYPDGVSFVRMEPVGHAQTRLVYQFWTPDGAGTAELEAVAAYGTQLAEEDIGIVEVVQQNLNAGVYERGPLSPRHENGLYHFHEMVRAAVDPAMEV